VAFTVSRGDDPFCSREVLVYEQIVARLEEAVAMGRLEPGERLPSVRDLAAEVGIAPGTVARAYSELEARGVVVTEGARGTRVASDPPAGKASSPDRSFLERLLRRPVVAAFHRGASAQQMREALDRAMQGILKML
jgi:DNA-binding transcriptional regulator YhcF (GntR family)